MNQASCPSCGGTVGNDGTLSGQEVACPFCSASFTMPAATGSSAGATSVTQGYSSMAGAAPLPVAGGGNAGVGVLCPHCQSRMIPEVTSKMSSAGIAVLIVLAITCLPLFWIGFFITEEVRQCRNCRMRIG